MVSACLEVETTRDIARQMLRHRSFSFQEFSQRYADPTKDLSFVLRDARLQDTKNRQNSVELDIIKNDKHRFLAYQWEQMQQRVLAEAKNVYEWAIEQGIAKEQARAVLPEGLTVSRLYMNGTLRSWVHFIELRSANGTQKEHQLIAIECARVIAEIFPMASEFISE
jgi:thymidylate synthase (FAD)